jgi:hypothetical protein
MNWQDIAAPLIKLGLTGLGTAFGGPLGGTIGGALGNAVAGALGVPATPDAVSTALATGDADALKAKLSDLESARQTELAAYQAQLGDVADARKQTVTLAHDGSAIAWGAPIVTAAVLLTFALVMFAVTFRGIPPGDNSVIIGLVETLKVLSVACVSYWVGSSSGSKRSSDTIRNIAQAAAK